jgi:hypothetical protein
MVMTGLSQRLKLHIELAVAGDHACADTRRRQELVARGLGMTGAEIDAARDGRSFDIRMTRALAVVCALRDVDPTRIEHARELALQSGIDRDELAMIERLAASFQQADG